MKNDDIVEPEQNGEVSTKSDADNRQYLEEYLTVLGKETDDGELKNRAQSNRRNRFKNLT
ncbi:hypothetical protein THIOKS13320051 [Thiocapsa sp. KS1]|nr:hypothetical protein THIOKS13320051 [Thiocapsa sp. KS1]